MNKLKKSVYSIIVILITIVLSAGNVFAQNTQPELAEEKSMTGQEAAGYFNQAVSLALFNYKFDTTEGELYKAALNHILETHPELLEEAFTGAFNSLDKYSTYYTEEQLESFITGMSGEFCGIGVLVMTIDEGLFVSSVYDGSPAMEYGIMAGDVITAVGDIPLAGVDISVAQTYILGEENTFVNLTVVRNGNPLVFNIQRKKVKIDSGVYTTFENSTIGYIQLYEFNENATEFTQKALNDFDSKNINNIIIDLRNNPGGSLNELVDMCSLFIPSGPAIHLEFKNPLRNYTLYAQNPEVKYNLIVLINENSASASEAFSAAVQDTGVGIVVGQTSYGKGTMQNLTPFVIGGGIKLTEAEYLSPAKRKINNIGVKPDWFVTDKITTYEKSDFEKITYDRILKNGDTGKDVLAIEQRLYYLGFLMEPADEIFDEKTHSAVMSFQNASGLFKYGVMDITTQLKLESYLEGTEITNDTTLRKAIDIFANENWKDYKRELTETTTNN